MKNEKKNNIIVLNTYNTSKTKIGICIYKNKKGFFKYVENSFLELEKYNKIKDIYKVPKILGYKDNLIFYEYIKDFEKKTINDYLYGKQRTINLKNILKPYHKSLLNTLCLLKENECEVSKYYQLRTSYLKEYLDNISYEYIIINNKKYNIKEILKDIYNNMNKDKKVYAFISEGDPTDTNITTSGYFTDFENAGYNSLLGEFAIFFISLYSHGRYFYPKYNKKAYVINKSILNNLNKYKLESDYYIDDNNIYVNNIHINLPSKNKKIILKYLDLYLNNPNYKEYQKDFKLIKYYLCMRLLSPIKVTMMEEKDQVTILTLMIMFYNKVKNLETLKELVKENDHEGI